MACVLLKNTWHMDNASWSVHVVFYFVHLPMQSSQVTFIYIAFNNTNCVKATAQYQNSVNDK